KVVEGRKIFKQLRRRIKRADENVGYQTHSLGQAASLGEKHERARALTVRLEMVLGDMNTVITQLFDQTGEFAQLAQSANVARRPAAGRHHHTEHNRELHCRSSSPGSGLTRALADS